MKGKRYKVPLMITRTESEFKMGLRANNMADFKAQAEKIFGSDANEFLRICGDNFEEAVKKSAFSGIELAARALQKRDEELGIKEPIYYAVFDAEIPGWDKPGTFHSVDLWFFFETLAKCWRPFVGKHYDLARQMCNYWANFIKTGDPNGEDADGTPMPQWKPYTDAEPNAMVWGDKATPVIDEPDELMKLLMRHYLANN
jgi:para-nitrobenzyl esterase